MEGLTLEKLHRDKRPVTLLTDMEDRHYVRVLHCCDGARFTHETTKHLVAGVLRANHLEGDGTVQINVLSLVHDAHAAFAQLLNDPIVGDLCPRLWRIRR
jgi:hypothetical protein